jgi:hypothetical protein
MVLHHVAQAAGALVKHTPPLNAKGLGQRDLHAGDMVAVPDRLQKGVGEAKIKNVHDRFLAEEAIDAENGVFGKRLARDAIQLARRGRSRPNGFSTITRACAASPAAPSPWMTIGNNFGGMAR